MIPERQGKRKEENTGEKEMMRKYATTKTKRRKQTNIVPLHHDTQIKEAETASSP